ncbi:MAG: T9SS type A sorting domain-containing protein [Candidatus Poribacteria bacterium]|nr:T9SS type A sorting domain-containing protein [Candidatus Poribacteria bacterium]MDE0504313.1 T9SS type A sorting domain-containing protein [Candidatus Poribacteria bacterium]
MKTPHILFISVVLIAALAAVDYTAFAQKEIKLEGAPKGMRNKARMPADLLGDTIIVGAHAVGFLKTDGFAKIYTRRRNQWEATAELIRSDRDKENPGQASFGFSVAITGPPGRGDPTYAIVGSPSSGHQGGVAVDGGAAYIFAKTPQKWKQEAKLIAPDPASGDGFGWSVDIDSTTAVVGVPKDDDAGSNSGAVFVFVKEENAWKQQAKLLARDTARSDSFGEFVALENDTLVIGAPGHTHADIRFAGAAYVFERQGERWIERAKLTADDAAKSDRFGVSVAIHIDTIIVGSTLNDAGRGKDAGAAYVYVREGNAWRQHTKLVGDDSRAGDHFGAGVATTGEIAIIGAPLHEEEGLGSGAAYAFLNTDGVWKETEKIVPDNPVKGLVFGSATAISRDTVIVTGGTDEEGAPGFGNGSAAYVYSAEKNFGLPPYAVKPDGLKVTTIGGIKRTALLQNFPNPFNPETWLPYNLATDSPVSLSIYNVRGHLMRELDLGSQNAGNYLSRETAAYWDGKDSFGEGVASGVYFYTLRAGSFQATRRMLVLK